ncbi:unannotated protein [freshwater metagenome]|uniref:Unannotated protein n=1 Tax=freshwater metagenome TaxID=449393 RepID=A0A6J6T6N9_9ZZZZ|nr:L-2-hydroxyglutarate oxidase [Actinomycetota bacterium]MSY79138.1 L-2-hydroxyglutarate oxidase [Actinomycetota bacterium]MTA64254.1 L-2-hydroxyglutarate oxidase [Actinomycetota bacterium]
MTTSAKRQPARFSADAEVTVVGAGIVGLAAARAIQLQLPKSQVLVLDKEPAIAQHQTGRNSGVIHSGLYYAPGSAKARLVARGRVLLEQHCRESGIAIDWCGKVVIASRSEELPALNALHDRGVSHGLLVHRIGSQELHELEPHAAGLAALHVPEAGIVDYSAVASSLAQQIVHEGGTVQSSTELVQVEQLADRQGLRLSLLTAQQPNMARAYGITTRWLVNCAGLQSDRVARLAGCDTLTSIIPFRGDYKELANSAKHLVRGLIYPLPDPRWPFLGVHFTPMMDKSVHVGPNAVLSLGREAYNGGVNLADTKELLRSSGLRHLAAQYWRTGATELIRSLVPALFLQDAQRLIPEITQHDLLPAASGIRAQAVDIHGHLLDDFAFANSHHAVHVLNAPSPAATASLAIGQAIAERLLQLMQD